MTDLSNITEAQFTAGKGIVDFFEATFRGAPCDKGVITAINTVLRWRGLIGDGAFPYGMFSDAVEDALLANYYSGLISADY